LSMAYPVSGLPLRSIVVLDVESLAEIQFNPSLVNPKCCSMSSKNGQATESKVWVMSTLSSRLGRFIACSSLAEPWINLKLSWMALPLMKALCL
jgi:hypothetical protein